MIVSQDPTNIGFVLISAYLVFCKEKKSLSKIFLTGNPPPLLHSSQIIV